MSRRSKTVLCCCALLAIAAIASAFLIARAAPERSLPIQSTTQVPAGNRGPRNLFLQPEALRVARQLGKRFSASTSETLVVAGTLTSSAAEQPLSITRRQTNIGEQVDLLVGSSTLTWSDQEGTKAVAGVASDEERLLVERLTLDSPDQFVLAQLRGASYFTVARNIRPTDAKDGYTGALWDIVRVVEPQEKENGRLSSPWRIYYLNVETSLPDRIEYELNGQPITVDFLAWTKEGEEKTPAHVRWSSNGKALLELRVINVSYTQQ